MYYNYKYIGGVHETANHEYEYQTILPDMQSFIRLYKSIRANSNYEPTDELRGKEVTARINADTKKVHRVFYEAPGKRIKKLSYNKQRIDVTHPFISIDLSTTLRHSTEAKTHDEITYMPNARVRVRNMLRLSFESKSEGTHIDMTLKWMSRVREFSPQDHILCTNIINMINDDASNFLLSTSQRMFATTFEVELPTAKAAAEFKNKYLELLSPVYHTLAGLNTITKMQSEYNHDDGSELKWPPPHRNIVGRPLNLSIVDFKRKVLAQLEEYCVSHKVDGIHTFILYSSMTDINFVVEFSDLVLSIFTNGVEVVFPADIEGIFVKYKLHDFQLFQLAEGEIIDNSLLLYDYGKLNDASEKQHKYVEIIAQHIPRTILKPKYHLAHSANKIIERLLREKYQFPTDGLIFTVCNNPNVSYKWKPDHTIDFTAFCDASTKTTYLMVLCPVSQVNDIGLGDKYKIFYNKMNINPMMFSMVLVPFITPLIKRGLAPTHTLNHKFDSRLGGLVLECSYKKDGWHLVRVRDDKVAPNQYKTALLSFINNINNISEEMLINPDENIVMFFDNEKRSEFETMRYYHSSVRASLIERYIFPQSLVLDLGSGRGNTFFKMSARNPQKIVMMDIDGAAITEFFMRLFSARKTKLAEPQVITGSFIDPDDTAIVPVNPPYNVIFCSFAVHFAFESMPAFLTLIDLIRRASSTQKKTKVIFLAIDGQTLFERLRKNNQEYRIPPTGPAKYYFHGLYGDSSELLGVGYEIDVKYPFSGDNRIDREYLADFDLLTREMYENGFDVVESKFFSQVDAVAYGNLSKLDAEYSSLHRYIVYERVR